MTTRASLASAFRRQQRAVGVRSSETRRLVDTFLACTVLTILVVRFFLIALGYPQLGGDGLHIAHLLWGGLLMLLALMLAMVSLSRASRLVTAVLGGVGFGLLIDEIGKFVTSDNNYFFRPTFALIYVALVLVWLGSRMLLLRTGLRPQERLANALDYLRESTARPLTEAERDYALQLLDGCEDDRDLAPTVRRLLEDVDVVDPAPDIGPRRVVARAAALYERLVATRLFKALLSALFVALTLITLITVVSLAVKLAGEKPFSFLDWAQLTTNGVLCVLLLLGLYPLYRRSRLAAYRWFELALLFSIFVVQIFDFADIQLWGVLELLVYVLLLIALRLLIAEEEHRGATETTFVPADIAAAVQRTGAALRLPPTG